MPNSRPITGAESRRAAREARERQARDAKRIKAEKRDRSEAAAEKRRGARAEAVRDKPTGVKRTGGGNYTTYAKDSAPAKNFREAFAKARRKGQKTFTWRGRRYTTETA